MMGNPGQQPPPEMVVLGLAACALLCAIGVLAIVMFVGMCMCCTVPSESGAKGRAITAVVLVGVAVLLGVIGGIALFAQALSQAKRGMAPPPGQLPFSPTAFIVLMGVSGLSTLLIMTMWMMFHKAIADYFRNARLSKHAVGFTLAFFVYTAVSHALQIFVNPMLQGGNVFAPPNVPLMIASQVFGMVSLVGLTVWFLVIVRETRRTIREDQPASLAGELEREY
jgi:hypothetical protein